MPDTRTPPATSSAHKSAESAKVTPISGGPNKPTGSSTAGIALVPAGFTGLGLWSFYFLLKLLMAWQEIIGFHPLENLAFAAALTLPTKSLHPRLKLALSIVIAAALLYYDSWLPPIGRAFATVGLLASFSFDYWLELAGRVLRWPLIAGLVLAWAAYRWLDRYVRMGTLVTLAMAAMLLRPLLHTNSTEAMPQAAAGTATDQSDDDALKAFYAQESQRAVTFTTPPATAPAFDIVFLHICSLSWDDLRAVGLDTHPLWQRFDVLMTHFNSAASYSGPAAIRLHRGTCGQKPHTGLYSPAADSCYLMDSLKQAGFQPNLAMNHDGHFDDFLGVVQNQKFKVAPMSVANLPVQLKAFDDTPVYEDFATLSRWLEQRKANSAERVALYYNSISLHDGNRYATAAKGSSLDTYKPRLQKLLDDMDRFIGTLEKSGRRVVLAVIPEHGAAIRGDKMQIAGLREIPSSAITLVPVGVRVIGPQVSHSGTVRVDAPTSYLAVNQLVAKLMEVPPFTGDSFNPADYAADLPSTELVSENEDTVIMARNGRTMMRQGKDGWSPYDASGGNH